MIGSKLAHYEITSHLGSGGMGEVYQASDSKLGRNVAIKILPQAFAGDEDRRTRFEHEARVLASLNHPHIAAIYGLEEAEGRNFLIMELVAGETLAERIAHGSIPTHEALAISHQIAQALEAAHDKGIVHRDLKPANIKVTRDGQVKVLDFGLAKAFAPEAEGNLSNSPTLSRVATNAGMILGTAAYMSPEQAQGKELDRRTDIFAFGCVLYEMLTARQAFFGESLTEILAGVLKSEADWNRLPEDVTPPLRRLLRRCLQKDRNRRFQYAGDLRIELEELQAEHEHDEGPVHPVLRGSRSWPAWLVAVLLGISLLAVLVQSYFRTPAAAPEMRVDVVTPSTPDPLSFAISPDGQRLAFVASGGGPSRLWLRSLSSATAQPLNGTEGASFPFWSPDNQKLGFFAEGKLKRIGVGGAPQTLADAALGRGGTWTQSGMILFSPTGGGPLLRVPESGGAPVAATKLGAGHTSHRFPQVLPDGRRFIYWVGGDSDDVRGIYLGALDSSEAKRLTVAEGAARYLPSGWLLFISQGTTLVARRLDLDAGQLVGNQITVADPVGLDTISRASAFSISANGFIAYRPGIATRRQLTWFDRSGKALGTVGPPDENGLADPELSDDGARIAVDRNVQNDADIYLIDGVRRTRFTFRTGQDSLPIWSPDGSRIVFRAIRKNGKLDLYNKPSNGAGEEDVLVESAQNKTPTDWSPDG